MGKKPFRTVPPHKHTVCQECGTVDKPLFAMPTMKHKDDFYCEGCKKIELEKRAKK